MTNKRTRFNKFIVTKVTCIIRWLKHELGLLLNTFRNTNECWTHKIMYALYLLACAESFSRLRMNWCLFNGLWMYCLFMCFFSLLWVCERVYLAANGLELLTFPHTHTHQHPQRLMCWMICFYRIQFWNWNWQCRYFWCRIQFWLCQHKVYPHPYAKFYHPTLTLINCSCAVGPKPRALSPCIQFEIHSQWNTFYKHYWNEYLRKICVK